MSSLVIAEHNNQSLNIATLNAVAAAGKLSGEVHVLVAGHDCGAVAQAAAQAGVAVTRIGQIDAAPGLRLLDAQRQPVDLPGRAFDHFA